MNDLKINKSKLQILILIVFIFSFCVNLNIVSASQVNSFDVELDILSPQSAKVVESWKFDFDSQKDLMEFKDQILEINIDISKLKEINDKLEPHVYINGYNNVKIGFDEIKQTVTIEYYIEDLCLIKYLDYDNEIIWKLNENLFRDFVKNNLYSIPINSYLKVKLYEPLFFGEILPKADIKNDVLSWTGLSSNELRLIAIEKKPPKPTFVLFDLYNNEELLKIFGYLVSILFIIILLGIIFKKKISKKIQSFVVRNSKIKTQKNMKDIVDTEYFRK
jgi:hypothetical protein